MPPAARYGGRSPCASPNAEQEQHRVALARGTGWAMGPPRAGFLLQSELKVHRAMTLSRAA